jgi:DNA-binding transcriptional regulator YiaG
MPFNDRISLLMAVLRVSNSALARALSVDASLVSRWRTGARMPAKNSAHIKAIAAYFAGQAKMDY